MPDCARISVNPVTVLYTASYATQIRNATFILFTS